MSEVKKYKKSALVLSVITGLLFLWFVFQQIRDVYFIVEFGTNFLNAMGTDLYWFFIITFASIPILSASLFISFSLLQSIRKEETPFTGKNVIKLKSIAILLVIYEIYVIISQRIIFSTFFRFEDPKYSVVLETSFGGAVIVLGLIIYCIALVSEYGITLQNQVDETL